MENELTVQIGEAIVPMEVIEAYHEIKVLRAFVLSKIKCRLIPQANSRICENLGIRYNSEAATILGALEEWAKNIE